jgi:hypothetical protein
MFQLTKEEVDSLRFQFGISKTSGLGGRRYPPYETSNSQRSGSISRKSRLPIIEKTFTEKDVRNKPMPATRLKIFISGVQKEFEQVWLDLKAFLLGDAFPHRFISGLFLLEEINN